MANLKVIILHDVWESGPPEPGAGTGQGGSRQSRQGRRVQKKKDPLHDREEIFKGVNQAQPRTVLITSSTARTNRCTRSPRSGADPHLQPNGVAYAGDDTMDKNIAAYLQELLHIPYTGGGPEALYLAQDKSIAKKIFDFHKIKTPDFAISYKGTYRALARYRVSAHRQASL